MPESFDPDRRWLGIRGKTASGRRRFVVAIAAVGVTAVATFTRFVWFDGPVAKVQSDRDRPAEESQPPQEIEDDDTHIAGQEDPRTDDQGGDRSLPPADQTTADVQREPAAEDLAAGGPAPWELPRAEDRAPERASRRLRLGGRVAVLVRDARIAMSERRLETADGRLALAAKVATSSEERTEIDRCRSLYTYLRQFWDATRQAALALGPGDQFDFRSIRVTVVRSRPEQLFLKARGKTATMPTGRERIDAELAVALAARGLEKSGPAAHACVAAFLALDRDGHLGQARQFCDFAGQRGVPVQMLTDELRFDYWGSARRRR